jgi:hypothetical protein
MAVSLKGALMNSNRTFMFKVLAATALAAMALPASAEHNERHDGGFRDFREHNDVFREHRDIRNFDRHDYAVWRSGGWRHGRHEGRLGWWWVVGGMWYLYPWPVYPYPDPYLPPYIATQPYPSPVAPPAAQFWYFCTSANGYYPYVPSCPDGWKTVPATPPDASPVPPPR